MNTVAKGNTFEERVFEEIKQQLESGRLGLQPSSTLIYKKKPYYSPQRNSEIVVDIAIEVWLPNAEKYSLLWVCECKDYKSTVSVDNVEEFKAKLDQIAGKNIKGVVATTSALQKGALEYCRANGIGVVRILPSDQVTWVVYMLNASSLGQKQEIDPNEFEKAMINPSHKGLNREFFSNYDKYIFGNWHSLLVYMLKDNKK